VKKLADAARKAAHKTSLLMTSDIRQSAVESGWSNELASNTHVMYDGTSYHVEVRDDLSSQAMDLEYGTPSTRPTAVVRKYANNTQQIEQAFVATLEKELGVDL
jgi:hypothetical protein